MLEADESMESCPEKTPVLGKDGGSNPDSVECNSFDHYSNHDALPSAFSQSSLNQGRNSSVHSIDQHSLKNEEVKE